MALPDELLALAKELVDRNPGAAVGGDLRRGVSTAYYALFVRRGALCERHERLVRPWVRPGR
jgi:hypothetical protein